MTCLSFVVIAFIVAAVWGAWILWKEETFSRFVRYFHGSYVGCLMLLCGGAGVSIKDNPVAFALVVAALFVFPLCCFVVLFSICLWLTLHIQGLEAGESFETC